MTAVQSAAGGSGNAGGIRFEHRCLAWALAYLLTERPLPGWAGGAWVVGVGSQTFREVDDLGILTDVGGWINAQVKKGLQCSTAPSGELADALAQCVALKAAGVPDRPPAQQARRLLDRQVDRVVILTDHEASTVITKGLANVTNRLRSWPVQLPLDEAAVNRDERRALEVLRQHVLRLLSAQRAEPAGEADLRSLARFLAVRGLDLRPEEGADQQALSVVLREIVERPEQAGALWARLESIGQDLAVSRSWLQRDQLIHLLESGPGEFRLTVASRLRRDVARLREITAANLAAPPTALSIGTPDGPAAVPRTIAALLPPAQGEVLAVTGEPGCGKSVLLHSLAVAGEADVIYLTHQQLRNSAGQTRIELNLEHELAEILLGWTGSRPGRLLLDGLDQTRGSDAASWLPQLAGRLRGSRWSVIGSIRLFDLRHGLSWRSMFAGNPLDTGHAHPDLGQVSHVLVDDLNDTELAALHTTSPALRTVAERAGHRLQMLLANPFNLSLVGELLTAGLDVSRISSRLDLLARFRELRVTGARDGRTRHRALATLVTAMVARRCQEISDDVITDTSLLAVVNDLLSDGVLRDLPVGRWTADRVVGFAHPVLFDYEVALHSLGDLRSPGSLADVLDTDPDRVITVRPSLDYRLAMIWHEHANREAFWDLAHRLMAHWGGHVLAAAAAAAVAARELHEPADLRSLEAALVAQEPSMASRDDLRALTFLLAAGLSTSRNAKGLDAFGHLLGTLADAATHSDDSSLACC